jgi:outer membrane lipoprotein LolB
MPVAAGSGGPARRAAVVACGAAVVLAGCASLAPPLHPPIVGRLSVQVAAHDGEPVRGLNASFDLRGDADAGELRLSSLVGPQLAAARWAPGRAVLVTSDGETAYPDLDHLSREALGEALPLRALPDWLAGRPWPGAPSTPEPPGFVQLGWQLDLTRWGEGFISATRQTPPRVTLRVRVDRGERG